MCRAVVTLCHVIQEYIVLILFKIPVIHALTVYRHTVGCLLYTLYLRDHGGKIYGTSNTRGKSTAVMIVLTVIVLTIALLTITVKAI